MYLRNYVKTAIQGNLLLISIPKD